MVIFTRFGGKHFAPPDPRPLDIPKDTLSDQNNDADFELPDQNTLIHAFLAGLSKESATDLRSLSQLLATLPDSSQSSREVEARSVTDAREHGFRQEASDETLQAFSCSEMKLYTHAISYK